MTRQSANEERFKFQAMINSQNPRLIKQALKNAPCELWAGKKMRKFADGLPDGGCVQHENEKKFNNQPAMINYDRLQNAKPYQPVTLIIDNDWNLGYGFEKVCWRQRMENYDSSRGGSSTD